MTAPVERDFADVERLLAMLCAPRLGGEQHVGSHTPEDLEQHLPFLQVTRIGGGRTALYDYPIVELSYLDTDGAGRAAFSRLVNFLLGKPPPHPAIDLVGCDPGPRELPWGDNDEVRHWGATLFLEMRRVRVDLLP